MVLSSQDLDCIARRLKKGDDHKSYQEFFGYFGPRLRSYYLKRGVPDAEDMAMDLLNDIALEKIHHYRETLKFKAWVRRVALNRYYDWRRKNAEMLPLREEMEVVPL